MMGNKDFLYDSKTWDDSREGVRIRSRSWRVQSPPLENCKTIRTYTIEKYSEAIPGRDGTKFWFRGEKRKKIWRNLK